jgi:hypothetical protein
MTAMRCFVLAALVMAPLPAVAQQTGFDCVGEVVCVAGGDCATAGTDFALVPQGDGFSSYLDAGEITLAPIGPPEAEVRSFAVGGAQSVAVMLSLFPDNRFALTVHEEIDGPHVETVFGTCRPEV